MTPKDQNAIAAIITTLAEVEGSPESMLYLFFDMDLEKWNGYKYALTSTGIIEVEYNFVTLTDKGHDLAAKLNAVLNKKVTA